MTKEKHHVDGLSAYEAAHKKFWQGEYAKALTAFESISDNLGSDGEISDRVNTYVSVCKKRLSAEELSQPETAEELHVAGIVHMNNGELEESIERLSAAVNKEKNNDLYQFSLACAYARSGDIDKTLTELNKAIELNESNKIFASNQSEFIELAELDEAIADIVVIQD